MGDEVKLETIQKTQQILGKFVKKPPLTDKLLKKPPFRFLHDVITTVISNTGFLAGLYTAEELQSENVKDREAKIKFLQKLISTVQAVTGLELTARPSKIIAGHEPEKTNELLQAIGKALQKKLNSDSAVAQMKEGKTLTKESKPSKEKEKSKKPATQSPPKKIEKEASKITKDATKKRSDSTSRIPNATPRDNKANVKETKSTVKKSTSKTNVSKQKDVDKKRSKENKTSKLDLQLVDPNNIQDHFIEAESVKNEINKNENIKIEVEEEHEAVAQNETTNITDVTSKELQESNTNVSLNDKENINTEERQSAKLQRPKSSKRGREVKPKIEQVDLSDTESNQLADKIESNISLTEKDEPKDEKRPSTRTSHSSRNKVLETNAESDVKVHSESETKHSRQKSALKSDNSVEVSEKITNNSLPSNEIQIMRSAKRERSNQNVSQPVVETIGDTIKEPKSQNKDAALEMNSKSDSSKVPLIRPRTSLRPPSARPSSARPAAPRVRDKTDVIVPPEQMVTLGKVNVIVENFSTNDNDEEEESLVVVESASDIPEIDLAPQQNNSSTENESMQGHLVAQILETQKELIDDIGNKSTPVEIEWEADGQRNREAKKRDIESLRSKIQTVTRAAHPLGQIINYLQEDYDNLLRELKQWQNENEKLNKEIEEQNSKSDQLVSPLTNQFEEIKDEIQKQQERNAMIKAEIFRNQRKIDSLLSGII